jgi:DNA helicase-2/ATP-dependent DNA helicase PcrA
MNAVDFDDLIARPVWMLETNEELAYRWAGRFRYLMVDEYQDTNLAQLKMLKRLGARHGNVCVVGDDDQSIYGWRGAEAGNILEFDRHFPGAETIALTRNYRSTNNILKAANELIGNNSARHEKSLWSELGDGPLVRYRKTDDADKEAHWIATDLLSRKKTGRLKWSDFSILYRTNAQSRSLEDAIRAAKIPYRIVGGQRFYDRREIKDMVAYLRVLANPYDESAFRRIVNYPPRGIGDISIERIGARSLDQSQPFWRVVSSAESVPGLPGRVCNALGSLDKLLGEYRQQMGAKGSPLGDICRDLVRTLNLKDVLTRAERDARKVNRRLNNVEEIATALDIFRGRNPSGHLEDFLAELSLDGRKEEDDDGSDDVVSLMTLHSSKGLEFHSVYLTGCEEGLLPHTRSPSRRGEAPVPPDLPEERRLMYVGITRARRSLTLTGAGVRMRFGKTQVRKPSRFLLEIPEALFEGGRDGLTAELEGDELKKKGLSAFDEMRELMGND